MIEARRCCDRFRRTRMVGCGPGGWSQSPSVSAGNSLALTNLILHRLPLMVSRASLCIVDFPR